MESYEELRTKLRNTQINQNLQQTNKQKDWNNIKNDLKMINCHMNYF